MAPNESTRLSRPNGQGQASQAQEPALPDQVQETQFTEPVEQGQDGQHVAVQVQRQGYGTISGNSPSSVSAVSPVRGASSGRVLSPDLLRGLLMILQSIDHASIFLAAWQHGVGKRPEADGGIVTEWNAGRAWFARMATHLCAPGFMFLLGMGVVYFGRSRTAQGWSSGKLLRHFITRGCAIVLVNFAINWPNAITMHIYFFNAVLIALAFNFALTGALWIAMQRIEEAAAEPLGKVLVRCGMGEVKSSDAQRTEDAEDDNTPPTVTASAQASSIVWHAGNVFLLVFTFISLWWNMWLSPHGGRCGVEEEALSNSPPSTRLGAAAEGIMPLRTPGAGNETSGRGLWFDFWFFPISVPGIISGFPPLAWLSFALFGMLYARILIARKWSRWAIVGGNASVGVVLALLFVSMRLLRYGNLSQNCLRLPEQLAHPDSNQYTASWRSFLYITKYPPDGAFFTLTMSMNMFLLSLFGSLPPSFATRHLSLLHTFGTSALFFYFAHFYIYRLLGPPSLYFFSHQLPDKDPETGTPMYGLGDGIAFWTIWAFGLALLSPLCTAYARFKAHRGPDSIWRMF